MCALSKYKPGTVVEWKHLRANTEMSKTLNYVFWAFKPCVDGFRHCRKIISVDGTHLYTKYKHKMLIGVTLDGNNQVLPLAFAIVDEETTDSWKWFLENLGRHVVRGENDYACRKYEKWARKSSEHRVAKYDVRELTASVATVGRPSRGQHMQVVKLSTSDCSCCKWTIFFGIPCSYAICTAKWHSLDPTTLVQPWYNIAEYLATYEGRFQPLADERYWDPPTFKLQHNPVRRERRRVGRDRTTRLRNEMDRPVVSERQHP
ncbi:uncharacterized protein LOC142544312 [Primulina tabacum]|uniref:uncharacterized protein LOC142544312 n=1 Tax=Primulina tabacum TaxID=48773 RepID=UPI003F5A1672